MTALAKVTAFFLHEARQNKGCWRLQRTRVISQPAAQLLFITNWQ